MTTHITIRIRLEPELEMLAATWSPAQCDEHAAKLTRWARQLRVRAAIMRRDAVPPAKKIKRVRPGIMRLN